MDRPLNFPEWCTKGDKSKPIQSKIDFGWNFLPDPNNSGKYIVDIAVRQWVNYQYYKRCEWYKYLYDLFINNCLYRDENLKVTTEKIKISKIGNISPNSILVSDSNLNLNFISINKLLIRDLNGNIDDFGFKDQINSVTKKIDNIKNRLTNLENNMI